MWTLSKKGLMRPVQGDVTWRISKEGQARTDAASISDSEKITIFVAPPPSLVHWDRKPFLKIPLDPPLNICTMICTPAKASMILHKLQHPLTTQIRSRSAHLALSLRWPWSYTHPKQPEKKESNSCALMQWFPEVTLQLLVTSDSISPPLPAKKKCEWKS